MRIKRMKNLFLRQSYLDSWEDWIKREAVFWQVTFLVSLKPI